MLSLLLDENISPIVASHITAIRPEVDVISLAKWQSGQLLAAPDELILLHASNAARTLLTYDQKTIAPLLIRLAQQGKSHGGVVFTDHRTIPSHDLGQLIRSLLALWDAGSTSDWSNRVQYLRAWT